MTIDIATAIIITLVIFIVLGFFASYGEYRRIVKRDIKFKKELLSMLEDEK